MNDTNAGKHAYPIGAPGVPWGAPEKAAWLARQTRKRSYAADVLAAEARLGSRFEAVRYGRLDFDPERYPLVSQAGPSKYPPRRPG